MSHAPLKSKHILGAANQPAQIRFKHLKANSGTFPSQPDHPYSKGHKMFKFLKYSALALALAFGTSTFAHAEAFTATMQFGYHQATGITAEIYTSRASAGAHQVLQ